MKKGQAFIISAPAGTGKTTLVEKLEAEFSHIVRNISYTTREPRVNEVNGKDYHFISFQEFEKKIKKGDFLEYAEVFGNFYGTCTKSIEQLLHAGCDVVLVIDTQGAIAIKKFFKGIYIFMSPPNIEELEKRLKKRKTESEADLKTRLSWARHELEQSIHYDYHITNKDLKKTYAILKSIFVAEKFKVRH